MSEYQYAFRAQKSLGLVNGSGSYDPVDGFQSLVPDQTARTYTYSPDGRFVAFAFAAEVRVFTSSTPTTLLQSLPLTNIVDLHFSPKGTYLSTWERHSTKEGQPQHKNLRIHHTESGQELLAFTQKSAEGWVLQYSDDEGYALRLLNGEVQVFKPALWTSGEEGLGLVDKLRVEGATTLSLSPGPTPHFAVFVPEKKGQPAGIRIHSLLSSTSTVAEGAPIISPTAAVQKTFFKADRGTLKWNASGSHLLLQTTTEVDNSNKSYYGETLLYLLTLPFGARREGTAEKIHLDKEGPVHDFTWSPNGAVFGVIFGFMPARTTLFAAGGGGASPTPLHAFPPGPVNFIAFNPQGTLLALAGFGNLAGKVDIYALSLSSPPSRRNPHPNQNQHNQGNFNQNQGRPQLIVRKSCTLHSPNTTLCSWSPDGRRLLSATLSPRLRVDNAVRVWWVGFPAPSGGGGGAGGAGDVPEGTLIHIQETEELYQASWKPVPLPSRQAQAQAQTQSPPPTPGTPTLSPTIQPPPSAAALSYLLTHPKNKSTPPTSAPGTPIGGGGGGAYRPPGARGLATPAIFKREDEGGLPSSHASSPSSPFGHGRDRERVVPGSAGYGRGGGEGGGVHGLPPHPGTHVNGGRGRYVPGAAPPANGQSHGHGPGGGPAQGPREDGAKRKRGKGGKGRGDGEDHGPSQNQNQQGDRERDRDREGGGGGKGGRGGKKGQGQGPRSNSNPNNPHANPNPNIPTNIPIPPPPPSLSIETGPGSGLDPTTPGLEPTTPGGALDPVGKKIRNLNKKLKAIQELHTKLARGERLEATQLKKMEGEAEIKRELDGLVKEHGGE